MNYVEMCNKQRNDNDQNGIDLINRIQMKKKKGCSVAIQPLVVVLTAETIRILNTVLIRCVTFELTLFERRKKKKNYKNVC